MKSQSDRLLKPPPQIKNVVPDIQKRVRSRVIVSDKIKKPHTTIKLSKNNVWRLESMENGIVFILFIFLYKVTTVWTFSLHNILFFFVFTKFVVTPM